MRNRKIIYRRFSFFLGSSSDLRDDLSEAPVALEFPVAIYFINNAFSGGAA